MFGTYEESLVAKKHPPHDAQKDAIIQERVLYLLDDIPRASRTSESVPVILNARPVFVNLIIKIINEENKMLIAEVVIFEASVEKENNSEESTLLVPNKTEESKEEREVKNKFIPSELRNIFALKCDDSLSNANTSNVHDKTESAVPKKIFFVRTVNAKQKNAPRFIMPSKKQAILPAYSLTNPPSVIRRSGEAM